MTSQAAQQACSFFLGRLEVEVARLRTVAFPGRVPGPQKWLNLVAGIIETAQGYLNQSTSPKVAASEVARLIQDAEMLGEIAYSTLQHIAGADATQIPEQVIAPFQRWVAKLQILQTIFFRAEHLPNYELAWLDARLLATLNSPAKSLTDAIGAIEWPALRVTVPGQAMGMLPHFAVVGHELGHAIQDRIRPDFAPHKKALDDALARITTRLAALKISFGNPELLQAQEIINNWTNELKADAVGHCLVGPAFFFALLGFLELAGRNYGIATTHPPSDLRRDILFEKLSAGTPSYRDNFLGGTGVTLEKDINSPHLPSCPPVDQLFAELLARSFDPVNAAICVELVPYAREIANPIFDSTNAYLRQVDASLIYSPDNLKFDLANHLDPLCELVPPIEFMNGSSTTAASLSSILNVGWAALLTRVNKIAPTTSSLGDETARRMERLHDLLLKGVELSEVRLLWEEHQ